MKNKIRTFFRRDAKYCTHCGIHLMKVASIHSYRRRTGKVALWKLVIICPHIQGQKHLDRIDPGLCWGHFHQIKFLGYDPFPEIEFPGVITQSKGEKE